MKSFYSPLEGKRKEITVSGKGVQVFVKSQATKLLKTIEKITFEKQQDGF